MNWALRYCRVPGTATPFSAPWPAGANMVSSRKMPGTSMRPMLRRSILSVLLAITLLMIGRRLGAHVPALDAETVVELLDRDRLGLVGVFLGAAERVGVHEGEMGESR